MLSGCDRLDDWRICDFPLTEESGKVLEADQQFFGIVVNNIQPARRYDKLMLAGWSL